MADDLSFIRPTPAVGDQRGGATAFPSRRRLRQTAGQLDEETASYEPAPAPSATDPARTLLEALDRLRATGEVRAADLEYARALRGLREYEETTRFHRADPSADPAEMDPA